MLQDFTLTNKFVDGNWSLTLFDNCLIIFGVEIDTTDQPNINVICPKYLRKSDIFS